jgi:hypothetical protein
MKNNCKHEEYEYPSAYFSEPDVKEPMLVMVCNECGAVRIVVGKLVAPRD